MQPKQKPTYSTIVDLIRDATKPMMYLLVPSSVGTEILDDVTRYMRQGFYVRCVEVPRPEDDIPDLATEPQFSSLKEAGDYLEMWSRRIDEKRR